MDDDAAAWHRPLANLGNDFDRRSLAAGKTMKVTRGDAGRSPPRPVARRCLISSPGAGCARNAINVRMKMHPHAGFESVLNHPIREPACLGLGTSEHSVLPVGELMQERCTHD